MQQQSTLFDGQLVRSNRIIYTPSDFAKANLIHLQETGELRAQRAHRSSRSGLASYLFFMVLDGSGALDYDGHRYELHTGDCVFVDCHRPYAHETSEQLWTLKWVHFYGPNLGGIYAKYAERGGRCVFTPAEPRRFETAVDGVMEIAGAESYIKDMELCEKLTTLLTLLMAQSWNPAAYRAGGAARMDENRAAAGGGRARRDLQAVKDYLDEHFSEKITLDRLAEQFFINKFYLTRVFKEQFGVSVNDYLLQVRITRAKRLLRFTDAPVQEIAHECGLNDANYFTRVFRRAEGLPPGAYRKSW